MFDPESTAKLLARARDGESEALNTLFSRYLPSLSRWARGRLPRWARDVADTNDLVQDTLLHTFGHIEAFEPRTEGALHAYLRQAVKNRIRDEIRKRMRRGPKELVDSDIVDSEPSPLEQAIGQQALDRYETALGRLREEERDLLIGRIELGLTYAELAEAAGKPSADAARQAARRALAKLVEEMHRGG
ncbi:MAG: sigma-70 family RNA polymerase sigma factor [Vicinamibacteria bacterium]